MEYQDIAIFLEIVRTRNLTKAAENMYLSQSVISNRLKQLEKELGYDLVQRSKGRRMLYLTQEGEVFIPIAERWKALFEDTRRVSRSAVQTLRIAANESAYYEVLCPFFMKFMKKHPDIKLSIQIKDSDEIYELVKNGTIDYGFAGYEATWDNVLSKCINLQEWCVVQYCEEPGPVRSITPSELDPAKELSFTGGPFANFDRWRERWFSDPFASPLEINGFQSAIPLFKEFRFWALCSVGYAKALSERMSLQVYRLKPSPKPRKIYQLRSSEMGEKRIGVVFREALWKFTEAAGAEEQQIEIQAGVWE